MGRLATQLKRYAFQRRGTVAHDPLADGKGACEGDLGHLRISHEFCPDDITAASRDIVKT